MDIKQIDCGIEHADKIYHISDVHIRTLKRHREYREVFKNMFDYIARTSTGNSIAVVTGDIVHSKLEMSPELVRMLTEFFNGFDIPTIVILGNHDMNLNNLYREDALSPVLDMINNPNIHFVKENGIFELNTRMSNQEYIVTHRDFELFVNYRDELNTMINMNKFDYVNDKNMKILLRYMSTIGNSAEEIAMKYRELLMEEECIGGDYWS